jgi:flavin reductase (DIM6/NTAB) family NADH-FMN oxidoreductase RutF
MDAVDREHFKEVVGHFATGVTIVTACDGDTPVGFTCQSFSSLSLEPLLIGFAAQRASSTWPRVRAAGSLAVNILDAQSEALARTFATSGADKFAGVSFQLGSNGAPLLEVALATVTAEIEAVHEAGDHDYVIARVQSVGSRHGAPLLYFRGGFGSFD